MPGTHNGPEREGTPITIESPWWQAVLKDITDLRIKYGLMEVNVANLIATQATQHQENIKRIAGLEKSINGDGTPDSPGINGNVIAIKSALETANMQSEKWRKTIIAIVTIFLTIIGLWFTSLEIRHKVSKNDIPAFSESKAPQVDASNPPLN